MLGNNLHFFASVWQMNWQEGEETEDQTEYKFVKVLGRANEVDISAGKFDFKAEYKIDFGTKTEYRTVSVLDIYSYHQDDLGNFVSDDDLDDGTQVNVLEEKKNIVVALRLAKVLKSLSLRRKVLRRLLLHWLRCKDSEIADQMTAFIESEATRLQVMRVEEIRYYTSYWRSRGRREHVTYSSYRHWSSSGNYYDAYEYVSPNKEEAKRWIKQSKADLNATAKMLIDKSYSHACYQGQQCVEKVLKGVLYAKCGIPSSVLRKHCIDRFVSQVRRLSGAPEEELNLAYKVANYYLPTRYPDNQPQYKVPAEEYSEDQAKEALEVAEKVYTALKKFADC